MTSLGIVIWLFLLGLFARAVGRTTSVSRLQTAVVAAAAGSARQGNVCAARIIADGQMRRPVIKVHYEGGVIYDCMSSARRPSVNDNT